MLERASATYRSIRPTEGAGNTGSMMHNASTLAIGMHGMTNMLHEEDEAVLISNGLKDELRGEQ